MIEVRRSDLLLIHPARTSLALVGQLPAMFDSRAGEAFLRRHIGRRFLEHAPRTTLLRPPPGLDVLEVTAPPLHATTFAIGTTHDLVRVAYRTTLSWLLDEPERS